jgi:hypothetical protein
MAVLNNPNVPTKNIGHGEIVLLPECVCGHPQVKHFQGGGCNEFKCICDSFVRVEEQPLKSAVADDFNSSNPSNKGLVSLRS